ncbi:DNL-type zinc finger protein [Tanacetum coccineum]
MPNTLYEKMVNIPQRSFFLLLVHSFVVDKSIKHKPGYFQKISSPSVKNAIEHEAPVSNAIEDLAHTDTSATNNTRVTFTAKSDLKISPRHDVAMVFACKVCDTRSVKTISRESYDKGVKGKIEDILDARGEEVSNELNGEKLHEKNLSWVDIFEKIPVYFSTNIPNLMNNSVYL